MQNFKMKYIPSMEGMINRNFSKIVNGSMTLNLEECKTLYRSYLRDKRTVKGFAKWHGLDLDSANDFITRFQAENCN